jgi:transcription-repair coupling factor (superfamily II helicase)
MNRWEDFPTFLSQLRPGNPAAVALADGAKPYLLAVLRQRLGVPVVLVTARSGRARELQEQIAAWSGDPDGVLLFPETDSLPHERMPEDPATTAARLAAMNALAQTGQVVGNHSLITHHSAPIVVACARAMMERLMSPAQLTASTMRLRRGQQLRLDAVLRQWVELGYESAPVVEAPGSFSRRGGILDIFPPGSAQPFRIELFGDEIDSIRSFDSATQRSTGQVDEVVVTPPQGMLPALDPDGPVPPGESTLLDYLPEGGMLVLDNPAQIAAASVELWKQSVEMQLQAVERGSIPAGLPPALVEWEDPRQRSDSGSWTLLEMRYDPDTLELPFTAPPSYGGKLLLLLDDVVEMTKGREPRRHEGTKMQRDDGTTGRHGDAGNVTLSEARRLSGGDLAPARASTGEMLRSAQHDRVANTQHSALSTPHPTVVLVSPQSGRLSELLAERDRHVAPVEAIDRAPHPGIHIVHGSLRSGWASDELGAVVLGDAEIFGWAKAHRVVHRKAAPRETFLSDLVEGDLAVHIEHGIGRYVGLQRIPSEGQEREYMVLEYAAGDKLYVPADQVDRVTRYVGAGDAVPTLSRLGTSEWARAKERVRKSVRDVARELLQIYSARQEQAGHAFPPDTPWQGELESSFPYVETPDQLRAISEVKGDMETQRPMDRLICGDVGYGKTEVALRAAFKAVMDGKQVAVLVPTTVLAQQHFATFMERLQAFPVNVEVLSRFRSEREQRHVLEGLRTGAVDICVGTHRLIQKDVEFKDLGLVIVDEEQRFGVMHKERLKQLRQEVDVLTLSATPIPRTLHMALAGIRDMSTMETPPEDRLPIRTFVTEYSDEQVREAILREMDRGGQVYFVHNRVQNIHFVAAHVQRLVPEARVAVGHGQMPEEKLERVMMEFAGGQHDVLVCTTIIESGLDIPNVNTIIVNQADRFGLAQLYQLRGRVGRGANRAYGYFLFSRSKQLTETAEKRLKTIFENTELGSGFRIAMKDLEIRGAGNLLGVEQHGQVNAVGFDLYTRLLSEAVSELQGKDVQVQPEVTVDLPLVAHLPVEYVSDGAARLSLYQRLAVVKRDEELGEMLEELRDRYGPLPVEAQNLFYLLSLKLAAGRIGIRSISTMEDDVVLRLEGIPLTLRGSLQRRHGPRVRVLPNQIRLRRDGDEGWVPLLQEILDEVEQAARSALATA